MKTRLLTSCALAAATSLATGAALSAQTTLLDFETAETSTSYLYFGNGDLDNTAAMIIDNPDASGVNTSAKVLQFEERSAANGALSYAGAYPDPAVEVDLTELTTVCLDFWSPEITTVELKLEGNSQDEPFWIRSEANTQTNTWEQLCFNTNLPSAQGDLGAGAGNVFAKATLFVGLDVNPAENTTYYIDNMILTETAASTQDVTFVVDLNGYEGDIESVTVGGTFNDFDPAATALTDDDSDGVYMGTVALATGGYEYLFAVNGEYESLSAGDECVAVSFGGNGEVFVNRQVTAAEETTLPTVAFGSCYASGESVEITFEVGTSAIDVDESGLYIAGGAEFGTPGQVGYRLLDEDEDGVYSLTIERPVGFTSYFTITNGACENYSCKENLTDLECGDADNFNDRLLMPVQQDTTFSTCFGSCETDTGACGGAAAPADVTFSVDMSEYETEFTEVLLAGGFTGWGDNPIAMSDDDGDMVYTLTTQVPGGVQEYKFITRADGRDDIYEEGITGDCVSGGFGNRTVDVDGEAIDMGTVCFASCTACGVSGIRDLASVGVDFAVQPTVADQEVRLDFGRSLDAATVRVYDVTGQAVQTVQVVGAARHTLDVSALAAGYYLVELDYAGARGAQRIVKQ